MKPFAQVRIHTELLGGVGFECTGSLSSQLCWSKECVASNKIIKCGFSIPDFENHFKDIYSKKKEIGL